MGKAPKRYQNLLGAFHIRSFWKIHFINPPEVQDQVFRLLIYGQDNGDIKVSKSPIWVNKKIAECVPNPIPPKFPKK
jgi:hypothetical protein